MLGYRRRISKAGKQNTTGQLGCPKCGGTAFTAKRSMLGKSTGVVTLGLGALIAPKSQVKCVTCGKMFLRG